MQRFLIIEDNKVESLCNLFSTTTMENNYGQQIIIRQCSEPTEEVKEIYSALKYKSQPFTRKKSVVPLTEFKNFETQQNRGISSG